MGKKIKYFFFKNYDFIKQQDLLDDSPISYPFSSGTPWI